MHTMILFCHTLTFETGEKTCRAVNTKLQQPAGYLYISNIKTTNCLFQVQAFVNICIIHQRYQNKIYIFLLQ